MLIALDAPPSPLELTAATANEYWVFSFNAVTVYGEDVHDAIILVPE